MNEKYWTANEVLEGIKEKPKSMRRFFPRFTVLADGDRYQFQTKASLDNHLQYTRASKPHVFVNAGNGITINFDLK